MLPAFFNSLDSILHDNNTNELLSCNEDLKKKGLVLLPKDIDEIIKFRSTALKRQARIELNIDVTKLIIARLSESSYVNQENFIKTINDFYEIFHFIKNSTSDLISDEDVLNAVASYYENVCQGSMELLRGKGIEKIIENFEKQRQLDYIEKNKEVEEYWNFDE